MAKKDKKPSRDQVVAFLSKCIAMMKSDETRQYLQDKKAVARPGQELIKLQRKEWEPLGINADTGCGELDQADEIYGSDKVLIGLRDDFIQVCMNTYLLSLEDRRPPLPLEETRPIPRAIMIEFFDACNTKMNTDDFTEKCCRYLQEHSQPPNQLIIEAQHEMLEVMGWEKNHGSSCLGKVMQNHPEDTELLKKFQAWGQKAQHTCMLNVQRYKASGGTFPNMPQPGGAQMPEIDEEDKKEVVEAIEAMTNEEKNGVLLNIQKKLQVFVNLPLEAKQKYVGNLTKPDRIEFFKGVFLMQEVMKQQWAHQQDQGYATPQPPVAPEAKPAQQQMM